MTVNVSVKSQTKLEQYGFFSQSKHKTISNETSQAYQNTSKPSVGIPFRNCGEGKGSYYDHYTLQQTTATRTSLLRDPEMIVSPIKHHLKQVTHQLPFEIQYNQEGYGLLYIPGISRRSYEHPETNERFTFQQKLIKEAKLTGRPILAVCGGCWQLWQEFGGTIKEVKDHNYRGGMPRIKETTGKVGHNKQVHRIAFQADSQLLTGAMNITSDKQPAVNSVHWLAPSEEQIPEYFTIAAVSIHDSTIAPHATYQGETRVLEPEPCIEAFESKYGAPIIGVQWHPEAYTKNTSREYLPSRQVAIIQYMIEAGKTFKIRQHLVSELHKLFNNTEEGLPWKRFRLKQVKYNGSKVLKRTWRESAKKNTKEFQYTHLFETGRSKPKNLKRSAPELNPTEMKRAKLLTEINCSDLPIKP